MHTVTLNTKNLQLTFSRENGALESMRSNETGWEILRRSELALCWRLLVPVNEELRNNPVYGEAQKLSRLEEGEGRSLRFEWDRVMSERAGLLDIKVIVVVREEDGQPVWYTEIENNSPYVVEAVYSPYLGDLTRPGGAQWFKAFSAVYAGATDIDIYPQFASQHGYYGMDYPTQFGRDHLSQGSPKVPFTLLHSEDQGLYVGVKANSSEFVAWHLEHRPGWGSSIDSRVSDRDEICGKVVHTRFAPVHMCYVQPGESRAMIPIAFEAYRGGWQKGADVYKRWRDTWSGWAKVPQWARDPHSWLQLHINSPEDELRLRFTELPKVAEECIRYGVKALQLVGWNDGGQDQGNPSHSFDPRLGTFEELKQAIADCQAMGVKVILFAKFVWADRATRWFREELIKSAVKDPYGDYYMHPGYKYFTPTQLLDINTKRLIPMCFGDEQYLKVCMEEFKKLIELNCDGFLFDECMHHNPAQLCFDPAHGHRYGWPVYANDREFIRRLEKAPGLRPDFMFAGEALYDWEYEVYSLSYLRSEDKKYIPLPRYLRPHSAIMTAVTGFEERNMINQCLMYRYIVSYEPYNFKGWLHDYPETVAYGTKMHEVRMQHREFLWDGEFTDTCGASVTRADGTAHPTYSRFVAADGRSALVICNYEDDEIRVDASLDEGALSRYRLVECAQMKPVEQGIVIPPRSAAIVF
jgi:hypothetical protein